MKAYNKKKKPKHFTKTKLKTFDDVEYFPTWLVSKRVSWTENGETRLISSLFYVQNFHRIV